MLTGAMAELGMEGTQLVIWNHIHQLIKTAHNQSVRNWNFFAKNKFKLLEGLWTNLYAPATSPSECMSHVVKTGAYRPEWTKTKAL